jgi:hypothetical protein
MRSGKTKHLTVLSYLPLHEVMRNFGNAAIYGLRDGIPYQFPRLQFVYQLTGVRLMAVPFLQKSYLYYFSEPHF